MKPPLLEQGAVVRDPGRRRGFKAYIAWLPTGSTALAMLSNDEDTDLPGTAQAMLGSR